MMCCLVGDDDDDDDVLFGGGEGGGGGVFWLLLLCFFLSSRGGDGGGGGARGFWFSMMRALRKNTRPTLTPHHHYTHTTPRTIHNNTNNSGSPVSKGILQPDMWGVTPSSGRWDWAALRAERAQLVGTFETRRAELAANALRVIHGFPHAGARPSSWWFPLVDPSGAWYRKMISDATLRLEALEP